MASEREEFVGGNAVRLLDDALPTMLEAIESAKRQIALEMYWFASDKTGVEFASALAKKAEAGVEVNVLYDAVGSVGTDAAMWAEMRARGVRVVEFHPVAPWRTRFKWSWLTWNRRDHRKILVVDGRVGFTGGVNLCDEAASVAAGGHGWRDAMVEITGPIGHQLGHLFAATWRRSGGGPLRDPPVPAPIPDGAPNVVRGVRLLRSGWMGRRRAIRRQYLHRIYASRGFVHLTNPYFVPDRAVVRALVRAARRGVDVRILLPAESDVPITRYAARAVYGRLLRAGVHVHEYAGRVLHAKTAVIDGRWSTVGSYNLDYRSWKLNLEVNAVIVDDAFGTKMEDAFQRDLKQAPEVDAGAFRMRSLSDRLFERIAYALRRWL